MAPLLCWSYVECGLLKSWPKHSAATLRVKHLCRYLLTLSGPPDRQLRSWYTLQRWRTSKLQSMNRQVTSSHILAQIRHSMSFCLAKIAFHLLPLASWMNKHSLLIFQTLNIVILVIRSNCSWLKHSKLSRGEILTCHLTMLTQG